MKLCLDIQNNSRKFKSFNRLNIRKFVNKETQEAFSLALKQNLPDILKLLSETKSNNSLNNQAKVDEMWSIIKEWIASEAATHVGYKRFKSYTSEFFWTPELIEESSKIESLTMEAQNLQDNSNSDDNDVTEAYRKLRDANEAFRDRLYKRRVEVFHSIVTDLAQPQNNGSFMRMVRSVKKRKLKDHCQLDHRNINQHMDYFKSTFGSAPMGNFVEEVNFDEKIDELVVENENLLSNDVNLNDDNESILLEEPSSISSINSININQSNANHEISNLPDSNLYSSSSSPSDLGEVMLIDLPCPSTISNSSSLFNSNLTNNQTLPYQVDVSISTSKLSPSSQSTKGKSLRAVRKRNSKPKSSNSSKSLLNYFKIISKSDEDLPISILDENNSKDVCCKVLNSSQKSQSLHSKLSSTNNRHDLNLLYIAGLQHEEGNLSSKEKNLFNLKSLDSSLIDPPTDSCSNFFPTNTSNSPPTQEISCNDYHSSAKCTLPAGPSSQESSKDLCTDDSCTILSSGSALHGSSLMATNMKFSTNFTSRGSSGILSSSNVPKKPSLDTTSSFTLFSNCLSSDIMSSKRSSQESSFNFHPDTFSLKSCATNDDTEHFSMKALSSDSLSNNVLFNDPSLNASSESLSLETAKNVSDIPFPNPSFRHSSPRAGRSTSCSSYSALTGSPKGLSLHGSFNEACNLLSKSSPNDSCSKSSSNCFLQELRSIKDPLNKSLPRMKFPTSFSKKYRPSSASINRFSLTTSASLEDSSLNFSLHHDPQNDLPAHARSSSKACQKWNCSDVNTKTQLPLFKTIKKTPKLNIEEYLPQPSWKYDSQNIRLRHLPFTASKGRECNKMKFKYGPKGKMDYSLQKAFPDKECNLLNSAIFQMQQKRLGSTLDGSISKETSKLEIEKAETFDKYTLPLSSPNNHLVNKNEILTNNPKFAPSKLNTMKDLPTFEYINQLSARSGRRLAESKQCLDLHLNPSSSLPLSISNIKNDNEITPNRQTNKKALVEPSCIPFCTRTLKQPGLHKSDKNQILPSMETRQISKPTDPKRRERFQHTMSTDGRRVCSVDQSNIPASSLSKVNFSKKLLPKECAKNIAKKAKSKIWESSLSKTPSKTKYFKKLTYLKYINDLECGEGGDNCKSERSGEGWRPSIENLRNIYHNKEKYPPRKVEIDLDNRQTVGNEFEVEHKMETDNRQCGSNDTKETNYFMNQVNNEEEIVEISPAMDLAEKGGVKKIGKEDGIAKEILMGNLNKSKVEKEFDVMMDGSKGGMPSIPSYFTNGKEMSAGHGNKSDKRDASQIEFRKIKMENDESKMGMESDSNAKKKTLDYAERKNELEPRSDFDQLEVIEDESAGRADHKIAIDVNKGRVMGVEAIKGNAKDIKQGRVMGKDDKKGGVDEKAILQFKKIENRKDIEGWVMGREKMEGGVDEKLILKLINSNEGGAMGIEKLKGSVNEKSIFNFNIEKMKGSVNEQSISNLNNSNKGGVMGIEKMKGSVNEKSMFIFNNSNKGGVMGEDDEQGGVTETGGVVQRDLNISNYDDEEGGVDVLMDLKFHQVKQKQGGVKEKGGVVEKLKFNLHKMILEDYEGGVDVVMGPEFEKNDIEIEEGGVMGNDNEKGGVDVEHRLQFNRMGDDKEIKEGRVMGKENEKGGVDVKKRFKFNMFGDDKEIEKGGVMGKDNEKRGSGDSNSFFGLSKRNIERGEGSVRKRKNPYQFIPIHEDESSINSFFSRRKRSRFNFVIDEEQANENEILENVNESRVYQNEMLQNESEFRVNQSQNQSHINPSFSINEDINGGEGGVQSS
ncbi:hypothetical protein ROZALSC1DRAFT_23629, partial [Rozella allomycis CSF55]